MDKRKNNGGARENSGRLKKDDVILLVEQMDAVLVPLDVWKALAAKIESGDMLAAKTWLQYRYGMPKQVIDQKNTHEIDESFPVSIVFTKKNEQQ
jgi:hypothetical protein